MEKGLVLAGYLTSHIKIHPFQSLNHMLKERRVTLRYSITFGSVGTSDTTTWVRWSWTVSMLLISMSLSGFEDLC